MSDLQLDVEIIDPRAKIPQYAHIGDACFDISVIVDEDMAPMIMVEGAELDKKTMVVRTNSSGLKWVELGPHESCVFHTGWKCGTDNGKVLLLFPRSSTGIKKTLMLSNTTGVIDTATYRGEVLVSLTNFGNKVRKIYNGDKVVQGMLLNIPTVQVNVVDSLNTTVRGEGGIGSTGGSTTC